MRRYAENFRPARPYKRRPGAYGLILRGEEVLLTLSTELGADLQLPGGGIDPGESPMHALYRETLEETGWRIGIERRLGVYRRFCHMPEYDIWAEKICTIYLCRPVRRIAEPTEPHHSPIWSSLPEVPELLADPSQSAFLRDLLKM